MNSEPKIIPVYFMPGMAASPLIFEKIDLPQSQFETHWLEWLIPNKNESLASYAKRMTQFITHKEIVLIGVSFGGVLIQEMSKYISTLKLIVVSSIKSKHELPKHMSVAKITKAYKLLPTHWLESITVLKKYVPKKFEKRLNLYERYLSVNNKVYIDWAIEQLLNWDQEHPITGAIYIHGNKDTVFNSSCSNNVIVIDGGTHAMIISKYRWFNENLPTLILEETIYRQ